MDEQGKGELPEAAKNGGGVDDRQTGNTNGAGGGKRGVDEPDARARGGALRERQQQRTGEAKRAESAHEQAFRVAEQRFPPPGVLHFAAGRGTDLGSDDGGGPDEGGQQPPGLVSERRHEIRP